MYYVHVRTILYGSMNTLPTLIKISNTKIIYRYVVSQIGYLKHSVYIFNLGTF